MPPDEEIALVVDAGAVAAARASWLETVPLWILQTTGNLEFIERQCRAGVGRVTQLMLFDGESPIDCLSRALFNMDDHHRFRLLHVFGAACSEFDPDTLEVLGIDQVVDTVHGCRLHRRTDGSGLPICCSN